MIKDIIRNILEHFNYYHINDLQHWGHCGLCGRPIYGVFSKYWAIGMCNQSDCYVEEGVKYND